jgi:peptide/nickel transport system substrate-binding protein
VKRRKFLRLAAAAVLAAPNLAQAQTARTLKFVPQGDLAALDPVQAPLFATRNHALLVFDTLYGVDNGWRAQPQMVEGHVVENDGKTWKLTLREGLTFHDNTPVLARDVAASVQRWGKRDAFGSSMMAVTDEISALSDRVVEIRLKKPFPLLPDALGKMASNIAVIMPERLARTDAYTQVTEMVGSGPYKFVAGERVPGSRAIYERFAGYVPRPQGAPSRMAGPKIAHFDRVEWITMPDSATAAAALQAGEIDWWEQPTIDLVPLLKRNTNITVEVTDTSGSYGFARFNFLVPPSNNPAFRRAALSAVSQADVMQAMAGTDRTVWRDKLGFFLPDTPMASDAGIAAIAGPVDIEHSKQLLAASGYNGEKMVFLVATDYPSVSAEGEVLADAWHKIGINVDLQLRDGGTVLQRVSSKEPVEKGGWNAFCAYTSGVASINPAANNYLRGSGKAATFGWPDIPRMEELRNAWFDAPDQTTQAAICREMQIVAFDAVPYIPTGLFYQPTAYRRTLTDISRGIAQFYGVRRI